MDYKKLSKEVSYVLRHVPWEYGLEMDEKGWVPIEQLLDALHRTKKWINICETDLTEMIELSEKKRHEIKNGRIRAFYGHSIPMKIIKEASCIIQVQGIPGKKVEKKIPQSKIRLLTLQVSKKSY